MRASWKPNSGSIREADQCLIPSPPGLGVRVCAKLDEEEYKSFLFSILAFSPRLWVLQKLRWWERQQRKAFGVLTIASFRFAPSRAT